MIDSDMQSWVASPEGEPLSLEEMRSAPSPENR